MDLEEQEQRVKLAEKRAQELQERLQLRKKTLLELEMAKVSLKRCWQEQEDLALKKARQKEREERG
jgi:hypothetical protein